MNKRNRAAKNVKLSKEGRARQDILRIREKQNEIVRNALEREDRRQREEKRHIVGKYDVNGQPTRQRSGMYGAQRVYEYFTQVLIVSGVDELKARYIASPILGIDNRALSKAVVRLGVLTEDDDNPKNIDRVYYSADVAEEDLQFDAETAITYVQGFIDYAQQVAATLTIGAK